MPFLLALGAVVAVCGAILIHQYIKQPFGKHCPACGQWCQSTVYCARCGCWFGRR